MQIGDPFETQPPSLIMGRVEIWNGASSEAELQLAQQQVTILGLERKIKVLEERVVRLERASNPKRGFWARLFGGR